MSPPPRPLAALAIAFSAIWIALALWLPFWRLDHPFEIEWMGGAFADHVARILDGERLYVAPSADFIPYLYTPLYMYLAAGVSLLTGEGFLPLRLTSILASIATLVLLFVFVRRRTHSPTSAIVTCGIWSACYFLVETWYDAERVDSTFVALLLGTLLLLDAGRRSPSAIAAALLLVLAYFTKQTALLLAPPLAVFAAIRAPRRGALFALVFGIVWFATTRAMDALHDGWFSFYTWTLPKQHEYVFGPFVQFWITDSRTLWPLLLLVAPCFFARGLASGDRRSTLADGAWFGGLLIAGLASRMHVGGAVNVLMPTWLGFSIVAGLAWHRGPTWLRAVVLAQLAFFAIKFGNSDQPREPGLLDIAEYLPSAADRAAGERLVQLLREADGDVIVPFHGYLPRLAGKRGGAHAMAIIDIRGSDDAALAQRVVREFWDSARTRRAGLVVLDENLDGMGDLIVPGYRFEGRLVPEGDARTFMPPIGLKTRPILLFRRDP